MDTLPIGHLALPPALAALAADVIVLAMVQPALLTFIAQEMPDAFPLAGHCPPAHSTFVRPTTGMSATSDGALRSPPALP
ncbi:hypothetical protein [Rhizorhabdus sp. FW153]|uniref:hypothetical protein n=1 Tax=Rhizorhabdus sp. FW153 TaxID=3400216 RepID=UPI003CE93AF7